jgi:hypothetical protein
MMETVSIAITAICFMVVSWAIISITNPYK